MTFKPAFLLSLLTLGSAFAMVAQNEAPKAYPTLGSIVRDKPALDALLPADARIEVIASGFDWIEGPVWLPQEKALLFSNATKNRVMCWSEAEGVSEYLNPSGYTGRGQYSKEPGSNGHTLDRQGRLISCEHGDRRVSVLTKEGGKRTLADTYEGKRFNSPNDVVVKSNGDVYFTDPPYGLPKQEKDPLRELDFSGVYRVNAAGQVVLLTKELARPNGVAFSPDEKTLYVSQSDPKKAVLMAYPVAANGKLGKGRVFYDFTPLIGDKLPGLPDGLKVDQQGNVFLCGPGGVHILAPDGTHLGRIDTAGATAPNCAWGDDGSTLYIVASNYVLRVKTKTKGLMP